MRHLLELRIISLLVSLLIGFGTLRADPRPVDFTDRRTATFTFTGDIAMNNIKKMRLNWIHIGKREFDGSADFQWATEKGEPEMKKALAKLLIATGIGFDKIPLIGPEIIKLASEKINIYVIAAVATIFLYDTFVAAANVKDRYYLIYAPSDGRYKIKVALKGDWVIRPSNKVTIYDRNGAIVLDDRRELSSDGTYEYYANLPTGAALIRVGLGSGSARFHTAGTLLETWLDDSVPRNWQINDTIVSQNTKNLKPLLPSIGSTARVIESFGGLRNPDIVDGSSPVVSNLRPSITFSSDEWQAYPSCPGGFSYSVEDEYWTNQLVANESSPVSLSGTTATWTLTRRPDKLHPFVVYECCDTRVPSGGPVPVCDLY